METLLKRRNIDINRMSTLKKEKKVYALARKIKPHYRNLHEEIENFFKYL